MDPGWGAAPYRNYQGEIKKLGDQEWGSVPRNTPQIDIGDWAGLVAACPCIWEAGSDTPHPPASCKGATLCGADWARDMVRRAIVHDDPELVSKKKVIHWIGGNPDRPSETRIWKYSCRTMKAAGTITRS